MPHYLPYIASLVPRWLLSAASSREQGTGPLYFEISLNVLGVAHTSHSYRTSGETAPKLCSSLSFLPLWNSSSSPPPVSLYLIVSYDSPSPVSSLTPPSPLLLVANLLPSPLDFTS